MSTRMRGMGRRPAGILGPVVMLLALLGTGQASEPAKAPRRAPAAPACCYANPQYAGLCIVQPAKGETCSSILGFLNDPRSQGKSYCGHTTIRGGWKRVECATNQPNPPAPRGLSGTRPAGAGGGAAGVPNQAGVGLGCMLDLHNDGNPLDDILRMGGKLMP
jgi:hypothetical protein